MRAEAGLSTHLGVAGRAGDRLGGRAAPARRRTTRSSRHRLEDHPGQHHADAGPHAGAGAQSRHVPGGAAALASALERPGRLHLQKLIQVAQCGDLRPFVDRLLHLFGRCDRRDEEIGQVDAVALEVPGQPFLHLTAHLVVLFRQVKYGAELFPKIVVETADDDVPQIVLDVAGHKRAHRPGHRVHEHQRLADLDRVVAEGSQPHQPQLGIPVGHRLRRPPLEVGEQLQVHEHDLDAERRGESPRQREHLGEDRDVGGAQGVAARAQHVQALAVAEEDGRLVLPHDDLRAELRLRRPLLRDAVDDLLARLIEPFDDA